jgi:hypothetical protein
MEELKRIISKKDPSLAEIERLADASFAAERFLQEHVNGRVLVYGREFRPTPWEGASG